MICAPSLAHLHLHSQVRPRQSDASLGELGTPPGLPGKTPISALARAQVGLGTFPIPYNCQYFHTVHGPRMRDRKSVV